MTRMLRMAIPALVLLECLTAAAQSRVGEADVFARNVGVIAREGQPEAVRARLAQALSLASLQLGVRDGANPRIILLQTDKQSASVAGISLDGEVMVEKVSGMQESLYMSWLVGEITDCKLAEAAVSILDHASQLKLSPAQIMHVTHRVCSSMASTVAVNSLQGKK